MLRVVGFKKTGLRILPSDLTVTSVYSDYQKACASTGAQLHSETTFRRIWKSLMPTLIIAKPSSDLCWPCQRNNMRYLRYVFSGLPVLSACASGLN